MNPPKTRFSQTNLAHLHGNKITLLISTPGFPGFFTPKFTLSPGFSPAFPAPHPGPNFGTSVTLKMYDSAPHLPASPPPPGYTCAGPVLNDFVIRNERTPAAQLGGRFFFYPAPSATGLKRLNKMTLDFSKFDGLLPAVVTCSTTGRVLMVGFMNEAAWQLTVSSGNVTFYSRSRNKLWMKGESSGHVLKVREIRTDCDLDTVVISAENLGPGVCHDGYESCFYRRYDSGEWTITDTKTYSPEAVYGSK